MCDLANRTDTPICRSYASFSMNLKLGFWNQLGEWMEQGFVALIPAGYELSEQAKAVLQAIREADSGQQITILRNTVVGMGFDPNAPGSYKKVEDPVLYYLPIKLVLGFFNHDRSTANGIGRSWL